jgi:transposase
MGDLLLLSEAQMRRIAPHFPLSHGIPRVDDRRILSGILFVIRNGLGWRDAPSAKDHTRRSTIASSAGAGWECSTASSPNWHGMAMGR